MFTVQENIKRVARRNESFRKVVATGTQMQVTVMALQPGDDIGEEVHASEQIFVVADGVGEIVVAEAEAEALARVPSAV